MSNISDVLVPFDSVRRRWPSRPAVSTRPDSASHQNMFLSTPEEASHNNDITYRILIADLVVKKTRQRRAAGRKRLRWWKLKDEETKEKFRRNLVERLSNIDEATTANVEQWWEEIAQQIKKCGEELCGRSTGKRKKTGLESWWWNDETESAVREKKERLKIWKRTGEEKTR